MRALLVVIGIGMTIAPVAGALPSIVPQPTDLRTGRGTFVLRRSTVIVADGEAAPEAEQLAASLRSATGYDLPVVSRRRARRLYSTPGDPPRRRPWIRLRLDDDPNHGDEGYALRVRPGGITLRARTRAGLFYAGQTLRQLFPTPILSPTLVTDAKWTAPAVHIVDRPRFAWRGMHLDVARSFMPPDFVKKLIDTLALHKINRLHWHLTDDQGWRIEITSAPRLTSVGATRSETSIRSIASAGLINLFIPSEGDGIPTSGFYTQDEIRDVVAWAAKRHVTIVPEIDLPGHIQAAIAAYPELGNAGPLPVATTFGPQRHLLNAEESTFAFLETVLAEVTALFPGDVVHLGGDEALFGEWVDSPRIQERLAELGLPDEPALVTYFMNRLSTFLAGLGRRTIAWNDVLRPGLAPEIAIMAWTGIDPGVQAARKGHDVVMAPFTETYFDHIPGLPLPGGDQALLEGALGTSSAVVSFLTTTLADTYAFDPIPDTLTADEAKHVLGTQGLLWTEYIRSPSEVEQFAFPRMAALAEVTWTSRDRRDVADFEARLMVHLGRLDALGVAHRIPGS
jgi:hexosaminidase